MKKYPLIGLCALLLGSCAGGGTLPTESVTEEPIYAFFMANYPKVTYDAPSGNEVRVDNLLFEKVEIARGVPFSAPEADPTRLHYEFAGWYKEEKCVNEWDFATDSSNSSVYLYAKWGKTQEEEYVEPEYVFPETLIEENEFRVTGILNCPLNDYGQAYVAAGTLLRLKESPQDVRFAINYERNASITMTSAVYDESTNTVTVESSDGQTHVVTLVNNAAAYSMAAVSSNYESKAAAYENKGATYENYHVMLAGSSSMEFWADSEKDMAPIVSYNHGIGGTTVTQWNEKLTARLVAPYSPKIAVYYVGVNDIINGGKTGTQTGQNLVSLFETNHRLMPYTHIFYVLINKLPGYLNKQSDFDIANGAAEDYAASHDWLTCIDAGAGLLKENGNPHQAYFRVDGLHMSDYGYVIWGQAIKKAVMEYLG